MRSWAEINADMNRVHQIIRAAENQGNQGALDRARAQERALIQEKIQRAQVDTD